MSISVRSAVEEFLYAKQDLRHKTRLWYKQKLEVFVTWCEQEHISLEQIKPPMVRCFLALYANRSEYTRKGYAQVIRCFLIWCSKEEDYEDAVPMKRAKSVELPKVHQTEITIYTPEEINRLFEACKKEESDELRARARAIISILVDTGVRASELVVDPRRPEEETGLRMKDVHLERNDSYITVYGKGKKRREVGLGERSTMALRRYINNYRKPGDVYVFTSQREHDGPLTLQGLERLVQRLASRAGIEDAYIHRFRHTFAVNYLLNGGDLFRLMRLMGHTDVKTTQLYLRAIDQKQARGGMSVLDTMNK